MGLNWKNKVTQSFDHKSNEYDQDCDIQKQVAFNLAKDLPTQNISKILEIGCGTGNLTKHLIKKYPKQSLHITDISPAMLRQAQQKNMHEQIQWNTLDAENITTAHKYDLIVANMALQWVIDIDKTIEQLKTILNPGGSLFFTLPAPQSFPQWTSTLNNLNLPVGILDFKTPEGLYKQEKIEKTYSNTMGFLRSLKAIGAASPKENYVPLTPAQLKSACHLCDTTHHGTVTWHISYIQIKTEHN